MYSCIQCILWLSHLSRLMSISWQCSAARLDKVGNQAPECLWVACGSYEVVFWNSVAIITSNIFKGKYQAQFEFLDGWEGSNHETLCKEVGIFWNFNSVFLVSWIIIQKTQDALFCLKEEKLHLHNPRNGSAESNYNRIALNRGKCRFSITETHMTLLNRSL